MPDVREKLVELLGNLFCGDYGVNGCDSCKYNTEVMCSAHACADHLIANGVTVQECAKPLEEWGEDYGDVLWWKFPIEEPPYVGSPLDEKWPAYHTHWTPIVMPKPPKEE